jgi:alkanesulfonate monooxygenase SsuD/methylene tetrahydromethanopterin reductase-like flavin-dependent oxidoreductase (luciferase family)
MTEELKELLQHPSLNQMLKYSFAGSKETVKKLIRNFIAETGVDELIAVSAMYDINDRVRSAQLFSEIMTEINEENQ